MRDLLAGIGLIGNTIAIGTAITLSALVSPSGRFMMPLGRLWSRNIMAMAGIEVSFEGLENVRPDAPQIFMANHASNLDIPCIALVMPDNLRFLAKKSLSYIPFFGWAMLATGGCIFIDRGNHAEALKSLERAGERVRKGHSLLIFPEGTRAPADELLPFKKGPFHLAAAAHVPIVPVAISGTRRLMKPGNLRIHGGHVTVRFGAPIEVEKGANHADLSARTHAAISALLSRT